MNHLSAAIYVYSAASNEEQIASQIATCKTLALEKGLSVADVYTDMGKNRTNRTRLLKNAGKGKFQAVLVTRFDRFSRNPLENQIIRKQLQDAAVTIETVEPYNAQLERTLADLRGVHRQSVTTA